MSLNGHRSNPLLKLKQLRCCHDREMSMVDRSRAKQLAAEAIQAGKHLSWFEVLYAEVEGESAAIPWADLTANPNLTQWLKSHSIVPAGASALVVGCGLGDDAETLAESGLKVTAFDISPTCIQWCRERFPNSQVDYVTADLLALDPTWHASFHFVLEAYTLQVLPADLRPLAMQDIARTVAIDGTLLVICRGREEHQDPGTMPWPLLRSELTEFTNSGLEEIAFEDYVEDEEPPVRRFRVEYRKCQ